MLCVQDMVVRGAPAIGVTGALALAVHLISGGRGKQYSSVDDCLKDIADTMDYLVTRCRWRGGGAVEGRRGGEGGRGGGREGRGGRVGRRGRAGRHACSAHTKTQQCPHSLHEHHAPLLVWLLLAGSKGPASNDLFPLLPNCVKPHCRYLHAVGSTPPGMAAVAACLPCAAAAVGVCLPCSRPTAVNLSDSAVKLKGVAAAAAAQPGATAAAVTAAVIDAAEATLQQDIDANKVRHRHMAAGGEGLQPGFVHAVAVLNLEGGTATCAARLGSWQPLLAKSMNLSPGGPVQLGHSMTCGRQLLLLLLSWPTNKKQQVLTVVLDGSGTSLVSSNSSSSWACWCPWVEH